MDELYDQFERYLEQEMNPQERQEMDVLIKNDPIIAEEFQLYQQIRLAVSRRSAQEKADKQLETQLQLMGKNYFNASDSNAGSPRRFSLNIWMAVAGVAAAVVLAVMFLIPEKDLYKRFREFPDAELTLKGSETENNRLTDAADLFNSGKYDQALTIFTNYLQNDDPGNIEVRYYLALCQLELGNTGYARQVLTNFTDSGSAFATDANWFLALAHLRENNINACRQRLTQIPTSNTYYKDAQKLLKAIEGK
ncbi:MAG: tetratricopeptide repeat protein [Saprospiraceae bacterium]|nr:tetratricopeptide repeat protein [Saprospiraceae bacterium]